MSRPGKTPSPGVLMVLGALRSWFDTPARRRRGEDKIVIPGVLDEVFGKDIDEPDGDGDSAA
ncbi:MAG: hypothetical protein O7C01_00630 [Actinobacteria bacterium]|nr:hypothetical protein [Actinomycetota bacterium]